MLELSSSEHAKITIGLSRFDVGNLFDVQTNISPIFSVLPVFI